MAILNVRSMPTTSDQKFRSDMPDTNSLGGANELILPVRYEQMKK